MFGRLLIYRDGIEMHNERMTLGKVMAWLGHILKQAAYEPYEGTDRWHFQGNDGKYFVLFDTTGALDAHFA